MNLRILVLAALPFLASAQLLTFGVQGGVSAQTPLGRTDKIPFVAGPSVDVRIVKGLAFETGFLYQRLGRGDMTTLHFWVRRTRSRLALRPSVEAHWKSRS